MSYKNIIQSCHLNFLIGSGASAPFLKTLSNIELLISLTESLKDERQKTIIHASLINKYFQESIEKNSKLIENYDSLSAISVAKSYLDFFRVINRLILKRKNNLINKQVNMFTTNIDIFQEAALEKLSYEYNDGFTGYIKPQFHLGNFKKTISKVSQHYSVVAELPLFNIFKLHGSVSWKLSGEKIYYNTGFENLKKIKDASSKTKNFILPKDINSNSNLVELQAKAQGLKASGAIRKFIQEFNSLPIVNPTKDKFRSTTLNYTYYELLRMFSSELERENSVLFVFGFSFSDEHISSIVLRCAKSNPTLMILIFAFNEDSEKSILKLLSKPELPHNIQFIPRFLDDDDDDPQEIDHTFESFTKFFSHILNELKVEK